MPTQQNRQATLAECNALMLRQALPHTFGNEAEQEQAEQERAFVETKVEREAKARRELLEGVNAGMLARDLARLQAEQGVKLPQAPAKKQKKPTAAEQAALDSLAALTGK